ncbi:tetratricopeptide repeat protein [Nocardia asiatica]|uniref:tetratricopeptide repeat protein n=1 Tax=Nocardia asiatica TaxID=209252 RepID=UPI00245604A6|nr:tetratricopeptide repeat protein [Nocardia asiatica]
MTFHIPAGFGGQADVYGSVGRVAEAILLYERTLTDCERVFGADHRATGMVRDNIAAARQRQTSR